MDSQEEPKSRPARAATLRSIAPLAWLVLLVAMAAMLRLAGCARNSPAEADIREVRVTRDGVSKSHIRFSPDGQWIAYGAKVAPEKGVLGVFVIPRSGGEARKISPDTLGAYPMGWLPDSKGLLCRLLDGVTLYRIGLDGSIGFFDRGKPLTRIVAVGPDEKTELILQFNRDNREVGMRDAEGKFGFLANTPEWEEDAVFGPGPGEVTAVALPSYQASTSNIAVWSPKTRAFTPLPLPEGHKSQPAWSPDGKMMAFASLGVGGQWGLWLYDATTMRSARLTEGVEDVSSPAWTPDNEWLAFVRSTRSSHLYAGDPNKPDLRKQLTDGPARDYFPVASPDGKWIAFVRRPAAGNGGAHGTQLCVMPAAGGEVTVLDFKNVTLPIKLGESGFTWSPDGREIAVNANEGNAKMDIFRIGRDGRGLARVTVEPGDECDPRWSPDGRYIAYTRAGGGETGVAVVSVNGGLPIDLSPKGLPSESAVWSPGSDRIAYVSFPGDGTYQTWIAPLADPEKRRLESSSKDVTWPLFWTRDGDEIVNFRGRAPEWYFTAYSLSRGTEKKIAQEAVAPSGNAMYPHFFKGAERYSELFFPGGVVLPDGKESGDIYMVRAREIVKSRLLAARAE